MFNILGGLDATDLENKNRWSLQHNTFRYSICNNNDSAQISNITRVGKVALVFHSDDSMAFRAFCLFHSYRALLLAAVFWISQHGTSAFFTPHSGIVTAKTPSRLLTSIPPQPCYNNWDILISRQCVLLLLRLNDNPDGNKLESVPHSFNVTASTRATIDDEEAESSGTRQDLGLEEDKDSDFVAALGRSTNWTRNFYEYASAAAGTLGDIMSRKPEDPIDPTTTAQNRISSTTASESAISDSDVAASSSSSGSGTGLVTTAIPSGSLANRFGIVNPLDRMALTANGNLQRLVSSYYDAPVQVVVDSCDVMSNNAAGLENSNNNGKIDSLAVKTIYQPYPVLRAKRWDRVVHLSVHNQVYL